MVSISNAESGTVSVPQIIRVPVQQNTPTLSQSGIESLSGSETINGIVVPPEPSPELNNATLGGVDVNNNGVRDDVERVVVQLYGSEERFLRVFNATKTAQSFILSDDVAKQDKLFLTYNCQLLDLTQTDTVALRNVIFDTKARQTLFLRAVNNPSWEPVDILSFCNEVSSSTVPLHSN